MKYRLLGNSGLRVSELALGTMTFGEDWGWGAPKEEAQKVYNAFRDAGGNFIDTADLYTEGHSEELPGKFIEERALRDRVVPATKLTSNLSRAIRTRAATAARISTGRSGPRSGNSKLTTLSLLAACLGER